MLWTVTFGGIGVLLAVAPASAQSLIELHRTALASDPAVSGSQAQIRAANERVEQAGAALLPSVNLSSGVNRSLYSDHVNDESPDRSFFSRQTTLQLTQPLYKPAAWRALTQSKTQVEATVFQRDAAYADLVQRLITGFFDVLTARSELAQFQAQQKATAEQLAVAKRSFTIGTVSVTDVREAEAKFDTVAAQSAAAELDVAAKEALFSQLVGASAQVGVPIMPISATPALAPADLSQWLQSAEDNSPQINLAKRNLEVARQEVSKAKAGAYPSLDFAVSQQDSQSSGTTLSQLPQGGRTFQAGVTLNLPLYAGGGINAKVREALAMEDKAATDLEGARRSVGVSVRQAMYAALSAMAQFKGLQTAERSAETSVKANKRGFEVGMRINADVLNAQSQLFQTRRDKARAWHDAWANFIKLKAAAGVVAENDLAEVDRLFVPPTPAQVSTAAGPNQQDAAATVISGVTP